MEHNRTLREIEADIEAVDQQIGRRPCRDPRRRIRWTESELRAAQDRALTHRERAAWHQARHHRWRHWAPPVAERHRDAWQAHESMRRMEEARIERHERTLADLRERSERYRQWDEAARPLRVQREALVAERTARLTEIHAHASREMAEHGATRAEIREGLTDHARRLAHLERRHGKRVDVAEEREQAEKMEAARRAKWQPWEHVQSEGVSY
jgi:hypothetical protein